MRCAGSLQSLCVQRTFFGAPPRIGKVTCKVAEDGIDSDSRVEAMFVVVVRCFPAWTRRRSLGGTEVRRERSWRSVVIVVDGGTSSGITVYHISQTSKLPQWKENDCVLSPERSLTKICWVSAAAFSGAAVEEALEEDREVRILRSVVVERLMEVGRGLGLSSFYLRRAMLPYLRQSGCPLSYLVSFRFRWISRSWGLKGIGKVEKCGRVYLNQVALIIIVRRMEVKESARKCEVPMRSVSKSWEGAVCSRFRSGGRNISQL